MYLFILVDLLIFPYNVLSVYYINMKLKDELEEIISEKFCQDSICDTSCPDEF